MSDGLLHAAIDRAMGVAADYASGATSSDTYDRFAELLFGYHGTLREEDSRLREQLVDLLKAGSPAPVLLSAPPPQTP
jgi:hypothetical protein